MAYPEGQVRAALLHEIARSHRLRKTDSELERVLVPYYFSMLIKNKKVPIPSIEPWRNAYRIALNLARLDFVQGIDMNVWGDTFFPDESRYKHA